MTLEQAVEALAALAGEVPARGSVHLDVRGPVAEVVLDDPSARHALSLDMMTSLGRAVQALAAWEGAAVVLRTSTTDAFCAGANLSEVRAGLATPARGRAMAAAMGVVLDELLALPHVVVAVVEGPAVGGGAELLTAADHRIFGRGAWFQFRQAALGVGAGWGGVRRLVQHVPAPVALRWLSTSARVDAAAAQAFGYADVVADDARAAAAAFLEPVVRLPAAGVRACKRQLAAARAPLGDRGADLDAFAAAWGGAAHREALDR